ncbi:hypothetical protein D3C81_1855820 [compost metagenome]
MEPAKAPWGDWGKLNEGESAVSAADRSLAPVSWSFSPLSTSTGAALCRAVTSLRWVPTTTTVSRRSAVSAANAGTARPAMARAMALAKGLWWGME